MSDAPRFPAGWYADPDDPTRHRWWDGERWTEDRQAAVPATPPPYVAPQAPAAPQVPAYGAAAPYAAYPVAPAAVAPEIRRDIRTGTVWIWLVVLLPVVNVLSLLLIDWRGYLETVVAEAAAGSTDSTGSLTMMWTGGWLALTLAGYVVIALQIVFAFLDWRTLRARGVERPFHWAWIFFAVVVTNGVYVIGRGVVLRRRTGSGLGPVWAWIALAVAGVVFAIVFTIYLFNEMFVLFEQSGLFEPGVLAP